jgi:hypothetical protein
MPYNIDIDALWQEQNVQAFGGNSYYGDGGDATAVGIQTGAISDNDTLVDLGNPSIDVDANLAFQFQNVQAFGGNSVFGDGGDATAVGVQSGEIQDNDLTVA